MEQAIREGGVKDYLKPVHRDHLAIFNGKALRGMHPAVGREDPEGRHQRAERHHTGGEKVQPWADFIPAKQHHAKEACFKKEGG